MYSNEAESDFYDDFILKKNLGLHGSHENISALSVNTPLHEWRNQSPDTAPLNPLIASAAHIRFLGFLLAHYISCFKHIKDTM